MLLQHPLQQAEAAQGLVVAFLVVAVAGVAAADEHAVGALGEGLQDELRVEAAGAHDPDDAHVGRVRHARGAGQVGRGVGAPVAEEGDDAGLEAVGRLPLSTRSVQT